MMRSIISFARILLLGVLPLVFAVGGHASDDRTTQEILLGEAGISSAAAIFLQEQEQERIQKYGAMGSSYIAVQREIYQGSNGGPVLDSLGFNAFNLVRNPFAQTVHTLVLIIAIMFFFVNMANPKKQRDPPAVAVVEFLKKVIIGIIILSAPSLIYATAMALKNSMSMMVSNAIIADPEDPSGGQISDAYLNQMASLSDEQRASLLATQRAISQAVADHFKMMVGGDVEDVRINGEDFLSEIEAYSLAYLGQLGAAYNERKPRPSGTLARDVFAIELADIGKLSREAMILRLRTHFTDVLMGHAVLANETSDITLYAPKNFYFKETGRGTRQYTFANPTEIDGHFGRRIKEAFEYRDQLIDDYTAPLKNKTWWGGQVSADDKNATMLERATSLREQLLTDYYERVYQITSTFLKDSMGGYLKQTPHAVYVNQRLEFFGSSKADISLPGDAMNSAEEQLLVARSWIRSLFLWLAFILFDGMIEITIVLLWATYPLWFFEPTARAFTGRAKQLVTLCLMTAVFTFLLTAVEALTASVAHYFAAVPGEAVKSALGDGVFGSLVGWATNRAGASVTTIPIMVFYFILTFFALWKTPKIAIAIFKGGSIVSELAGGVATAGAASVMAGVAVASGGAGAIGAKSLAARRFQQFQMGRAMGSTPGAMAPGILNNGAPSQLREGLGLGPSAAEQRGPISSMVNSATTPPIEKITRMGRAKEAFSAAKKVGKEAGVAMTSGGSVSDYFAMRRGPGNAPGSRNEPGMEDEII